MEKTIINVGDRFVCYANSFKVPCVEKKTEVEEYGDANLIYETEKQNLSLGYENAVDTCYRELGIYFHDDLALEFQYMGNGKVKELSSGKLFSICSDEESWGLSDIENGSNIPNYYVSLDDSDDIAKYLTFIQENPLTVQPITDYYIDEGPILSLNDNDSIKELCSKKDDLLNYVEDDELRRKFIITMEELSKKVSEKTYEVVTKEVNAFNKRNSIIR